VRPRPPSEDLPAASPLFGKAHARNRRLPFGRPCERRSSQNRSPVPEQFVLDLVCRAAPGVSVLCPLRNATCATPPTAVQGHEQAC